MGVLYLINKVRHCIFRNWESGKVGKYKKFMTNDELGPITFEHYALAQAGYEEINDNYWKSLLTYEQYHKEFSQKLFQNFIDVSVDITNENFKDYMSLYDINGNNIIHYWANYVNRFKNSLDRNEHANENLPGQPGMIDFKNIFEMLLILSKNVPKMAYFQINKEHQTPFKILDVTNFKKLYLKLKLTVKKKFNEYLSEFQRELEQNLEQNTFIESNQAKDESASLKNILAVPFEEWLEIAEFGRFSLNFRNSEVAVNYMNFVNNIDPKVEDLDRNDENRVLKEKVERLEKENEILRNRKILTQTANE